MLCCSHRSSSKSVSLSIAVMIFRSLVQLGEEGHVIQFTILVKLFGCRVHRIVVPGFGTDFSITYTGECQCSCEANVVSNYIHAWPRQSCSGYYYINRDNCLHLYSYIWCSHIKIIFHIIDMHFVCMFISYRYVIRFCNALLTALM